MLSIDRLAEANIAFSFPGRPARDRPRPRASCSALLASLIPARRSTRLDVLDAIQAT